MTTEELLPASLSGMNAGEGAWAVRDAQGQIDVRTVSPTERAAKVNWLFSAENMFVRRGMTDERIERMWKQLSADAGVSLVRVTISKAVARPNGAWKLVPVEPSEAMAIEGLSLKNRGAGMRAIYKAMIAATPSPSPLTDAREALTMARDTLLFRHEMCGYVPEDIRTVIHKIDAALGNPPTELKCSTGSYPPSSAP